MRLNQQTLSCAHAKVKPNQNSLTAKAGILHLGFGAFHKAHQALITDAAMQNSGGDWKIIAVTRRDKSAQQQLLPQDGYYCVGIGYNEELDIHIVSAIADVLTMEEPQRVLKYMCDPKIKIVSLTITEKGYCHHPASGELDLNNPLIQHDLHHLQTPHSAIGYLVSALQYRKQHNIAPFTALSCDNLPDNGHVLRKVVLAFAEQIDAELYEWIKDRVTFPCTMVDRIVPRTTEAEVARIEAELGLEDQGCVITEPFLQWVIEDNFVNGRPQWEKAGIDNVVFSNNVASYEKMKLRLLNGSHSAIAYLGYLSGYQTVAQTMQDKQFSTFIRTMMDKEITPSLSITEIDLSHYKDQLIARFLNTALHHKTWQIAMDGSQKLPQRILQTLDYALQHNITTNALYLVLAAWMKYTSGRDEANNPIDVRDPMAATFAQIWQDQQDAPSIVNAYLRLDSIFSQRLSTNTTFTTALTDALQRLLNLGAKQCVYQLNKNE